MNKIPLNIAGLDGGVIIKKGGGGGATIKNQDKSLEIVENGTTEVTADAGFTGLGKVTIDVNVPTGGGGGGTTPSRPSWTGHADAEGLRAIGWTDEDIAYYQENGVNWNAEDDEYHKVTDDNKALYGVLTANNISSYAAAITYLPKINTSGLVSMNKYFNNCSALIAIPYIETGDVTDMSYMFNNCYALTSIHPFNTQKVTTISNMFNNCYALTSIPAINTLNVTDMSNVFANCRALRKIPMLNTQNVTTLRMAFSGCYALNELPPLDTSKVTDMYQTFAGSGLTSIPVLNTENVTNIGSAFANSRAIVTIKELDVQKITSTITAFSNDYAIVFAGIKNLKVSITINNSSVLSKESLLYIINNELASSAITITLHASVYARLANDADVVAALANHPNISIAQ